MLTRSLTVLASVCLFINVSQSPATGQELRSEKLLPRETKGYISVADVDQLVKHWDQTSLGRLFADEVMQPFVGDIREQLDNSFATAGVRTGITVAGLREVCSGEICLGAIKPKDKAQKHAIVAMAYVKGREAAVAGLLEEVDETMQERGAVRQNVTLGDVKAISYEVTPKHGIKKFTTYIYVHDDWLVAADHGETATGVLSNMKGLVEGNSLADVDAFRETMARCQQDAGDLAPDARWFIEPLGYSEVTRAAATNKKPKRADMINAMREQGFDAVRGVGGFVNLAQAHRDFEHRLFVYAPPLKDNPEKFELAARMLGFPLAGDMEAPSWVPASVSAYASATWDIQGAYAYLGSLIDEVAGDEGFFEDLKDSLKTDPNGPQIDLDKEVVAHLGDRATVITDCVVPVDTNSERFLIAIELNAPQDMAISLEKALGTDPNVIQVEIDGNIIWEIRNEEEEIPDFSIEVGGLGIEDDYAADEEFEPLVSSAAISIVKGHLVIASHLDFIVEMMRSQEGDPKLVDDADYQTMMRELETFGADQDCARLFSRWDEQAHTSYELLRQGRMPESQGVIGQMLNRILGPEPEEGEEEELREQKIDADELPDFQVVRRYLGTMGHFVRTEENGWFVAGLGLPKGAQYLEAAAEDEAVITTAAADPSTEGK